MSVLQVSINFDVVWARLCRPFLTPRAFKSYYRLLHRSLTRNVRAICPTAQDEQGHTDTEVCRMCLLERETSSHIYQCWEVVQIFEQLVALAKKLSIPLSNTEQLRVLGFTPQETVTKSGDRPGNQLRPHPGVGQRGQEARRPKL